MRIDLHLSDTDQQVTTSLPSIPRTGELLLWTDQVTESGTDYEHSRMYRVREVQWAASPPQLGDASVLLTLDPANKTTQEQP